MINGSRAFRQCCLNVFLCLFHLSPGFFLGIIASVVVYREIWRDKYKELQDLYEDHVHTHDDDDDDGDGTYTLPHVYSADLEQSLSSSRKKEKIKTERKRRKSTGNIYSYNIHSPEISYKYEPGRLPLLIVAWN